MSAYNFQTLCAHIGHHIEIATYGTGRHVDNVSVECTDCNDVLFDYDNPEDANTSEEDDIRKLLEIASIAFARDDYLEDITEALNLTNEDLARLGRKVDEALEVLRAPQG